MILHDVWNLEIDFSSQRRIEIEPVQEHLCTDTGLLLFRQLDGPLGFTQGLAAQWVDTRTDPTHSVLEMVRRGQSAHWQQRTYIEDKCEILYPGLDPS